MKKSLQYLMSLVIILSIVLAGCTPAATEAPAPAVEEEATVEEAAPVEEVAPTEEEEPAEEPTVVPTEIPMEGGIQRGGTLTWARGAVPENLDMAWSTANQDFWIMVNIIEPLVMLDDAGKDLEPGLAESWELSDDQLTYTFHLRDAKFNNGADLTADDVVFSIDRVRTEGSNTWLFENIASTEAVDAKTFKMTLLEPSPAALALMSLIVVGIYNKTDFESLGVDEFMKDPVTTGPFMVKEWKVGEVFVMEPNPYYWKLGEDGKALPYLDEIIVTQVPEDTTKVLQVQSETILGTDGVPFSMIESLKSDAVAEVTLWPATQSYYIFINHTQPPFDDVNIRLALNYAVDREALVQVATSGVATPAKSFFSPGSACWTGDYGFDYDPDKARELIAQSKYADGEIPVIHIDIPAGRLIGIDIATTLQDMWSQVGFIVETTQLEGPVVSESFSQQTFTAIAGYQWTDDVLDPEQQTAFFMIDPALYSSWTDENALALADAARKEFDPVARCDKYKELQKIFNEQGVAVILFNNPFNTFINKKVNNFYQIPLGWLKFGKVWLSE
ncbi:MAG: ABC transporter substrate-binding protein [Anaerolineaceae bacterium]|nr:ABC transporter substrate-binding protein [Anaerolineaceae bacterium]